MAFGVNALGVIELPVTEQLRFVWVNCLIAREEFGESPTDADLVSLTDAGITLDRLAEGADPGLLARASLARALAAQTAPKLAQGSASHAEIAPGPIDMQP